jgi:hypothetical protein
MRDICVGAAFDVPDAASGTAGSVFGNAAPVFVFSRGCIMHARCGPDIFLACIRTHWGGFQVSSKGG